MKILIFQKFCIFGKRRNIARNGFLMFEDIFAKIELVFVKMCDYSGGSMEWLESVNFWMDLL